MLYQGFDSLKKMAGLLSTIQIPDFIANNLRMDLRPYQEDAYQRFVYYCDSYPVGKNKLNKHLLYHMATGSGKTLLMAGLILELYSRGYRNFLFFVNSSNIIEKTRDNFTNPVSDKYLFADNIIIEDKKVYIRSVDNFEEGNPDDINICFSTVQGLHSRMNTPRENSITEEDFENKKIVLIADEAHHINAWTKNGNLAKDEEEGKHSWEETITNKIFLKNPANILLEFTATLDVSDANIARKYDDKLIFDYSLKQFRLDKYSKEICVVQSNLPTLERTLQALILSQYRMKLAGHNGIFVKPVVLLKSKTIKESGNFYTNFYSFLRNLNTKTIQKIRDAATDTELARAFDFFDKNKITDENLILELQNDFSEEKALQVNSKSQSEDKQLLLNSLESENNETRLIFAVDMLDEGWDVLNLFDIVRLYETRDGKNNKVGKTTMREAQLIGRGARYYPFVAPDKPELDKYKRKYDSDSNNPLAILETLCYHSVHNPKYITEIKRALRETGIMPESEPVEIHIKDSFKNTEFYKNGLVYTNERIKNTRDDKQRLSDYLSNHYIHYPNVLNTISSTQMFAMKEKEEMALETAQQIITRKIKFSDLGKSAMFYAFDTNPFFSFSNLRKYFPQLQSLDLFVNQDLSELLIQIRGTKARLDHLTKQEKREIALFVLTDIASAIRGSDVEFKGTTLFKPKLIKDVFTDKKFIPQGDNIKSWKEYAVIAGLHNIDLFNREWLVYDDNFGTSEEQALLDYFDGRAEDIKQKYSEFYLVRNEKQLKVYNFDDGRAMEPDFVLFTIANKDKKNSVWQIFVEPKGNQLLERDKWKEDLLESIENKSEVALLGVNNYFYKLFGTPFFNVANNEKRFDSALERILDLKNK